MKQSEQSSAEYTTPMARSSERATLRERGRNGAETGGRNGGQASHAVCGRFYFLELEYRQLLLAAARNGAKHRKRFAADLIS
jgi:hypothetical protein